MRFMDYIEDPTIITESINDKGILKAVFMTGSPGAGKSYVIQKIKSGQFDPRIVNTDKFHEFFTGGLGNAWKDVGEKSKQLTKNQLVLYLDSMLPLWVDGTSSNPPAMFRRNGILKSVGYDTAMIWVDTPLEDAIERNKKRKRTVPEEFIIQTYKEIIKLKSYYASEFSNFTEILNGEGELNDKMIVSAFKKMESFFAKDVQNPIGRGNIEKMLENGDKYLTDSLYTPQYLKKLVNSWYRR